MPDLADANLNELKYVEEVTPGTTPAAALTLLRNTGNTLNGTLNTTESSEIRTDRSTADLVPTSGQSAGDINLEWTYGEYNPFIESALGGALSTAISVSGIDISAASADNSYNSLGSGFPATILPGEWIIVAGFTGDVANNGISRVVSATTSKIVVERKTLVDDAAGETVTVKGQNVRNGSTVKSFSIEEEQTDLTTTFRSYVNMIVNTLNISADSGSIITGSLGMQGTTSAYDATATIGTGADVASQTNSIMSATSNVGNVWLDGATACTTGVYFKSLALSIANNLRNRDGVCSLYPIDIGLGTLSAEIAMNVYFADTNIMQKHIANTAVDFSMALNDSEGNYIVVDIPKGKFSTASEDGKTKDSDVMVSATLKALYDPTDDFQIQISLLPV